MPEIQRQKNQALKDAVCNAIQGKVGTAIQYLQANVIEVGQIREQDKLQDKANAEKSERVADEELAQHTVKMWSELSKEERSKTLITAPMHKIRSNINSGIRNVLQEEGALTGNAKTFVILDNLNPTRAQASSIKFYESGMVVLFNYNNKSRGINKGEYLRVSQTNMRTGAVVLERGDGTKFSWRPENIAGHRSGVIDVFKDQEISLKVGDHMYWTRTDKQDQDIINSGGFKIKSIDSESLTVTLESGAEKVIANTNPILKHMDYAYAITVHAAQGKTYGRVIGVIQDYHLYLTNQKLFYVTISRARHQGIIITGDKKKLIDKLVENTGERMAATEHQDIKYSWIRTASSTDLSAKVQVVSNNGATSTPMFTATSERRLVSEKKAPTVASIGATGATKQQFDPQPRQIAASVQPEVVLTPEIIDLPMGSKILESIETYAIKEFNDKHKDKLEKVISGLDDSNKKLINHIKLGYIESHEGLSKALTAKGHSEHEIETALKMLSNIGNTHNIVLPCHNDKGYLLGFVGVNEKEPVHKPELSKNLDPAKFLFNSDNLYSPDNKKYWKPGLGKQLIIVDNPLNCLHIRAYAQTSSAYENLNNVVAVDRDNFTTAHVEAIRNKKIESIVLCLNDNDKVGSKAQICKVLSNAAPNISIKLAKLTNNNPADTLAIHGIDDLKNRIQQAVTLTTREMELMDDWLEKQKQKDPGSNVDIFSESIFSNIKVKAKTNAAQAPKVQEKQVTTKTPNTFTKTSEYNTKEIYQHLYSKIPALLPEFGFIQKGSFYISTTDAKIDGSTGKKGKVYIYANNPGIILDYTRENKSIWDYVKEHYMPSASNGEIMKYLIDAAGLSRSDSWAIKNRTKVPAIIKKATVPETKVDTKLLGDIYKFSQRNLLGHKNKVLAYLREDRKYSEAVIKNMGLGFIASHDTLARYLKKLGWSETKIEEGKRLLGCIGRSHKLIIPYRDNNGQLMGLVARNIYYKDTDKVGKYMYTKGLVKSQTLFNIHNNKSKELVVVEGMFDALNAQANGLSNFVTLGGVGFNENMAKLMQNKGIESIVLYLDQDEAGKKATTRIKDIMAKTAPEIKIKEVSAAHGIKDPDQLIRDKGVKALQEIISQAKVTNGGDINGGGLNKNLKEAFIFGEKNATFNKNKVKENDLEASV